MRGFCLLIIGLVSLVEGGCRPQLDPEQYGEVLSGLPRVPGAEKPYPLPEIDESADKTNDHVPMNQK